MLTNTAHLKGLTVQAVDGDLGTVDELYFDDDTWGIRYLTVDTRGWLGGRQVLISPFSVTHIDWSDRRIDVTLTKKQVENSPDIKTHEPISRHYEAGYLGYYGYPKYWAGPNLWGQGFYPSALPLAANVSRDVVAEKIGKESADLHLRSLNGVNGYYIEAKDGEIGHVNGFVMDDEAWAIRYFEVATRNWWPGKKVLISPAWIERVSWPESKVYVALSRESIREAPEYTESMAITRDYESRLYDHHDRVPYWVHAGAHAAFCSLVGD